MSTASLILHGVASPNVVKVVLMLEELGLDYALRPVGVMTRAQFEPGFLALNPFAKVPVLEDPRLGAPLFESGAILHYLAEREGRFLPAAQPARAEAMQWLFAQAALAGPMFGQLNHFRIVPPGSQPYAEARYAAQAEKVYRAYDRHLAGREWIAGGEYSIADMAMHPWAHYLERHRFDPAEFPALIRWRAAIDARAAAKRVWPRVDAAFSPATRAAMRDATPDDLDAFFGRPPAVPAIDYSAVLKL